jgi:hypothetical protein
MNMMLLAMFAAVGLGVLARGFGRREYAICLVIAAGLTLVYFFRPSTMT